MEFRCFRVLCSCSQPCSVKSTSRVLWPMKKYLDMKVLTGKKLPNKLSYGLEHPHLVVQHRTSIMMFFDHLGPSILGVEFKTVWLAEKKIKTAAVSFTKPTPIMSEHKSHLLAFSIHQSLNCTNTVKTHVKATPPPPPPRHVSPPICDYRWEKTFHQYNHNTTQCSGQSLI